MPLFMFLAFLMGSRQLPLSFLVSGLVGMTLFFTATAVSPAIFPWEGQAKTLERLASCPGHGRGNCLRRHDRLYPLRHRDYDYYRNHQAGARTFPRARHNDADRHPPCCGLLLGDRDAARGATNECAVEHHDALIADQVPARLHLRYLYPSGTDAAVGTGARGSSPLTYFHRFGTVRVSPTYIISLSGSISQHSHYSQWYSRLVQCYLHKRTMPQRM